MPDDPALLQLDHDIDAYKVCRVVSGGGRVRYLSEYPNITPCRRLVQLPGERVRPDARIDGHVGDVYEYTPGAIVTDTVGHGVYVYASTVGADAHCLARTERPLTWSLAMLACTIAAGTVVTRMRARWDHIVYITPELHVLRVMYVYEGTRWTTRIG